MIGLLWYLERHFENSTTKGGKPLNPNGVKLTVNIERQSALDG